MNPPNAYAPPLAEAPPPPKRRGAGCLRTAAILVAAPIVLLGVFLVVMVIKLQWARATTNAFCNEDVVVGGPVAGLEAKARARRLDVISVPASTKPSEPRPASFLAGEGFVFARTFCTVEHDDVVVLSKRVSSID